MTTSNLSIVDSLIRSHFGSNLWTKITDINFFTDDRIKQINQCFKDLPVKSKLYILMALGNLNNNQFLKWKNEVESIFLRAMVEGNLLVRAIATILQQKFGLNYLTFDISLSLENFADILIKLTGNTDDWDVSCECRVAEYISENVVQEWMKQIELYSVNNHHRNVKIKSRKRRLEIDEKPGQLIDDNKSPNIGCKLKYSPRSIQIKDQYLRKIEAECNKKRISVPIPGRNRLKPKDEAEVIDERDWQQKRDSDNLKTKKDSEINARLEDIKKRLLEKQSIVGKRESKVICLSMEELPPSGPRARQMIREKEKEAKRLEKEEKMKKLREEKEAEKCRKQQEKESKRLTQQMMLEQAKKEKLIVTNPSRRQLEMEEVIDLDQDEPELVEDEEDEEPEELEGEEEEEIVGKRELLSGLRENGFVSIPISIGGNYRSISIQQNQPQFVGSLQPIRLEQRSFNQNVSPITIISPHGVFRPPGSHLISVPLSQQPQGTGAPLQHPSHHSHQSHQTHQQQIVLIQQPQQTQSINNNPVPNIPNNNSASNNSTSNSNQYILSANAPGGMKFVRLVTASPAGTAQASPGSQQIGQPRLLRIITTPQPNAASAPATAGNKSHPVAPGAATAFSQPQMTTVAIGSNSASGNNTANVPIPQQAQTISLNPQSMQLETMKILIRYANRLTRPQKAMIVSYIAGSADGVDFNGQSSVHISSHRAVCLETFQPLNAIVDAFFLMDYHTGRWSIVKKYREPRPEEDICALDLQPNGYPPEFSMQA